MADNTTKFKVITPDNLGKTITQDSTEANKFNVKYDPDHFEWKDNKGIHLKDSVLQPLKDADIKEISLNSSNLELTKNNNTKLKVSLANLVPASKADKFLKDVTYNSSQKKLVFTVGNEVNSETTLLEVAIADLMPVSVSNGLEGKGTTADPIKIKLPTNNSLLKVENTGLSIDKTKLVELTDATGNTSLGYLIPKS